MTDDRDETVQTQGPASEPRAHDPARGIPTRLGRYTVIRLLGRGGVGAVYEAEDPEVGRRVAIKVLRDDRSGDTETLRREAQALGRLDHPNVVTVYDVGIADGDVFLVMQLVDGETIDAWLAARTASPLEIVAMFRQAGAGLVAAHGAGLVHCDFKPSNVLVDRQGVVRVTDFGLARATRAQLTTSGIDAIAAASMVMAVQGTPAYMAPEQFDGVATAASDQFAFCVALWETLAGERPFEDSSIHATDILAARGPMRELPKASKIPRHLVPILERGLAAEPQDRYPSMAALLAAIDGAAPRRSRASLAVAVLVLAGGGVAVALVLRGGGAGNAPAPTWAGADVAHRRVLTEGACDDAPVITAGKLVVFDRTRGEDMDIVAMPLAGGAPTALATDHLWQWRPNAGRTPGELTFLVHDPRHVTPDTIVYLDLEHRTRTTALSLFSYDAVAVGPTLYYSPTEPAGIRRIVDHNDQAFADPPPDSAFLMIAASPTGDRVALTQTSVNQGASHTCLADVKTRAVTCLPVQTTGGRAAFGADGTSLYVHGPDGIVRHDIATGRESLAIPAAWSDSGLAVAPDGSALVYSTCRADDSIVDAASHIVLPVSAGYAAAAPNGAIAWLRAVVGINTLVVRTADGIEKQLTDASFGAVGSPAFSPDGSQLVFAVTEPNPGIHTVNINKPGAPRQLTNQSRDQTPTWLPDNQIAFTRTDNSTSHVFTVPTSGGTPRQLSESTRTLCGHHATELLVDTGDDDAASLRWLDPTTGVERPGPPRPPGLYSACTMSTTGAWIAWSMGPFGNEVYRARIDPPSPPESMLKPAPGATMPAVGIDDTGRLFATQRTFVGGLVLVPAKPGEKF